jgi:hypothetical protein
MSHEFVEAVNDSSWQLALSILASAADPTRIPCPGPSPAAWLIDVNAPPHVVVHAARIMLSQDDFEADALGLLERCIPITSTSSNAFSTFSALLADGVGPNKIVCGGDTLLQHLVGLNRVREIQELLRHGVDPDHMNVFGRESTSNLEGARCAGNDAGRIAWQIFVS